jgi:hypothetical protein
MKWTKFDIIGYIISIPLVFMLFYYTLKESLELSITVTFVNAVMPFITKYLDIYFKRKYIGGQKKRKENLYLMD